MQEGKARPQRCVVLGVVACVHAAFLFVLLRAPAQRESATDEISISMALYDPPRDVIRAPLPSTPPPRITSRRAAAPAQTPDIPSPAPPVTQTGSAIDWTAEGRTVAARVSQAHRDADKGGDIASAITRGASDVATHQAGEQYQLTTGEKVLWLSNRCYLISDVPDPSTPSSMAHLAQSRTSCLASREALGDLFRQSAAYRKYHPEN